MNIRILAGFLTVLIVCSCSQRNSKNELPLSTGLQIENGPTRGTGFTDSLGTKYGLVYITATITNDTIIPIQLQLAFSKEYDYPTDYGEEQFKVLLLSEEWGLDGVDITEKMINELPKNTEKPVFEKTLDAHKKCVVTIGILRPREGLCSATPYAILEYNNSDIFPSCEWSIGEYKAPNPDLALGLKVGFCTVGGDYESCTVIPCGQISYLE